jgi:cytochrome b pre-mRNA-processing protein 3
VRAWLGRLRGDKSEASALYRAVVDEGRRPHWYVEGAVPDTLDGRFDMIAAVLSIVLLRLEAEPVDPVAAAQLNARLAERFIDDMDSQLREIGIGDIVVGKHVGKMMGMLGGRLGAYRDGLATGDLGPALVRNLYRSAAPAPDRVDHVAWGLAAFDRGLAALPLDALAAGRLA